MLLQCSWVCTILFTIQFCFARVFPWPGDTSWNLSTIFNRPTFELNIWTLNTPFASQLVSWGNLQNITQLCVSLNSTFLSNFSTDVNTGFQWLTEGATKLGPSKVADLLFTWLVVISSRVMPNPNTYATVANTVYWKLPFLGEDCSSVCRLRQKYYFTAIKTTSE